MFVPGGSCPSTRRFGSRTFFLPSPWRAVSIGLCLLIGVLGFGSREALARKSRDLPEIAGTSWFFQGRGKLKKQGLEEERWISRGKQKLQTEFVVRFDAGGQFVLEDPSGVLQAEGHWSQKKTRKLVLELESAAPPTAAGTVLGGVPSTEDGPLDVRVWRITATLRQSKVGPSMRFQYRFFFTHEGSSSISRYRGKVAGSGEGPPAVPNNRPVARIAPLPDGGKVRLQDGSAAVTLDAGGSEDGDGGSRDLAFTWSKLRGMPGDQIESPRSAVTRVTFRLPGVYRYRVTVDDGRDSNNLAIADVEVDVQEDGPGNAPPTARVVLDPPAGAVDLQSPFTEVTLDGSTSDDGDGGTQRLEFLWSRVPGPSGGDEILTPDSVTTRVRFTAAGTYVYKLRVSDGEADSTDETIFAIQVHHRTATLSWTAPTENEDGSELDDLAGFRVYHGECDGGPSECLDEANRKPAEFDSTDDSEATELTIQHLSSGRTYYFFVTALDEGRNESDASVVVFKTFPPP